MTNSNARPIVCRHCGKPDDEHCWFEAAMPPGCQCDPGEWGDAVSDVCPVHQGPAQARCSRCEHDRACHQEEDDA